MNVAKHTAWCEAAERALAPTLGEDRASIIDGVNTGRLELWHATGEGVALWLVTCCDTSGERPELCICCVSGQGARIVAAVFVELAKRSGCARLRWFSKREGWDRLLKMPVEEIGRVYRVELAQAVH